MFEVMQARQVGSEWHVYNVAALSPAEHMDGPYESEAEAVKAAELIASPWLAWQQ
jgi:hypothetical protein